MDVGATRPSRVYAVVVVLGVALHALVPATWEWLPYATVSVAALTAAVIGLRRHRPDEAAPWRLLAVALGLSCLGTVVWYGLAFTGRDPSPSHVVYLAGFGVAVAGAWRVGRRRGRAERAVALLDAAIVTTGASIVMWVFVAAPTWAVSSLTGVERLAVSAYPMITLVMLAALLRLAFVRAVRVRAGWLLVGGLAGLLAADLLAAVAALHGVVGGSWAATIRLVGLSLAGAAALHHSMRDLGAPSAPAPVQLHPARLALLWVASAAAPATLVVRLGGGHAGELAVIAVGSLVLFTLVVARMWGLLRVLAEYVRREHEDRFRALVENTDDVILIVDTSGDITYVSPSSARVLGYTPEDLADRVWQLVAPADRRRLVTALREVWRGDVEGALGLAGQILHVDGSWRRFEATLVDRRSDRAIRGIVVTGRDVTTRWGLEQRVAESSLHDPLTGLPNRALFVDRVNSSLDPSRDSDALTAVLLLDIDDFKDINEVVGHERGDEVLRGVGRRLLDVIRPQDTVARLGGDAFGVLLPGMADLHEVTAVAHRLLAAVEHRLVADAGDLELNASLGVALATPGRSAHDLLRDADTAMFAAKREERGSFRVFDPDLHAEAVQRLQLQMDLRHANERGELAVVYQPIHELAGEQMAGMEALLRWQHRSRGAVPPLEFIPIAEESGEIRALGRFVLRRACADLAAYRAVSGRDVFVTVNVSPVQLHDADFARTVEEALADAGLPPPALMLELTESIFLEQSEEVSAALGRLRAVGVRLAIDDFGTGYCSLGYLNRFRFDVVKIDKSFVDALAVDGGDHRLMLGMLELVASLQVPAVAEGVEVPEQLDALRRAGCPFGQGYLWSRPVPISQLPIALPVGARG